ncbi:MAG: phosphate/phosphite/phosphonate ABC transporter substrate-binding protein [Alphaproteobacteria bacterium]
MSGGTQQTDPTDPDRTRPDNGGINNTLFISSVLAVCVAVLSAAYFLSRSYFDIASNDVGDSRVEPASATPATINPAVRQKIIFGFDVRRGQDEDARQYLPFLAYLKKVTGYDFELRFTPKSSNITDDLGKGIVQLAAIGSVSYIKANQKYNLIPLVRGLNTDDQAMYRSLIVVHPDSDIESIEDLRGKRLAFGGKTSTQGHVIPRIILDNAGVRLADLADYTYTGSHKNCANAVISAQADACGLQDTLGRDLAAKGMLRILHVSKPYPSSGIAASAALPIDVRNAIADALIGFQPIGSDAQGLYDWNKTEMPHGFTKADKYDYVEMKASMNALGLL